MLAGFLEDFQSNPTRKDNIENEKAGVSKTANQTKCDICQKIFKSADILQTHDEKFHMKKIANKGQIYKCDQCGLTSKDKSDVPTHINGIRNIILESVSLPTQKH